MARKNSQLLDVSLCSHIDLVSAWAEATFCGVDAAADVAMIPLVSEAIVVIAAV